MAKPIIKEVMTQKQARAILAENGFRGIVGDILSGYMAYNCVKVIHPREVKLTNGQGHTTQIRSTAVGHGAAADSDLAQVIIDFFKNTLPTPPAE